MARIYRNAFSSKRLQRLLYHLVVVYSATFRYRLENEAPWLAHLRTGGRVLLCAWHQQFFSLIRPFHRYAPHRPALMISRSRDGELVAGVARLAGWHTVRGSSSKGGRTALKEMIRHLRRHRLAGHVVDGPQGPMGRVKAGAVQLARLTDAAMVSVTVAADRAWYFNSWDRFFVPKPFARVAIRFGPLIHAGRPKTEQDFEAVRVRLESVMRKDLRHPDGRTSL